MHVSAPLRLASALTLAAAFCTHHARADVSSSTTVQITESGVDFAIAVNGIPKVHRKGARLNAVPYFIDDLLRDGRNDITVTLRATDPAATLVLTLSAPAPDPSQDGPELARLQCGLAQPSGARPACKREQSVTWHIDRPHRPEMRLWQAADAPGPDAQTLASLLAQTQQSLTQDAHDRRWGKLLLINDLRGSDLLAAGGSMPEQVLQMPQFFAKADAAHPGRLTSTPPPQTTDLQITPLPSHLWLATRKDGKPLLAIQIGDGTVPGSNLSIDPEDSGDEVDRFLTGAFVLNQAIYGYYSGKWQLVR